jgi:DNA gyrase subunit A
MSFREGDELLAASVVPAGSTGDVVVVTDGGYTKRTPVNDYRVQGRGGYGIKVAKASDERGDLVASLIAGETDELLVIMGSGRVMRTRVADIRSSGRDTYGVILTKPGEGDSVLAATLNSEVRIDREVGVDAAAGPGVGSEVETAVVEPVEEPVTSGSLRTATRSREALPVRRPIRPPTRYRHPGTGPEGPTGDDTGGDG